MIFIWVHVLAGGFHFYLINLFFFPINRLLCFLLIFDTQQVDARIYLWKWNTRIVISDVDGTITK